jgi:hypothetical protein
MKRNRYPSGWNSRRIKKVLKHYENQSETEAAEEDEAAFKDASKTMIEIPRRLIPTIRRLLIRNAA